MGVAWAGTNEIDGVKFTYDDKYSLKDYADKTLLDAKDLEGMVIYGSCFSKEIPDTKVFPDKIKKLTFYNCNLDNVYIKTGWSVVGGSRRRYKSQNDLCDWIVDKNNLPIEPLDKEKYVELGVSILPENIPQAKMSENILQVKEREIYEANTIRIAD